jgi:hypothetical protein
VTTIRETTNGTPRHRVVEAAAAPAIAIVMTTGANLRSARAIAMTTMRGRSDVVLETTGKGQPSTDGIAITIPAGPTEIATIENAIQRSETHSADMFTCLADPSASSFTTAMANQSSRVQAVIDWYAPTDFFQMDAHRLPRWPFP